MTAPMRRKGKQMADRKDFMMISPDEALGNASELNYNIVLYT